MHQCSLRPHWRTYTPRNIHRMHPLQVNLSNPLLYPIWHPGRRGRARGGVGERRHGRGTARRVTLRTRRQRIAARADGVDDHAIARAHRGVRSGKRLARLHNARLNHHIGVVHGPEIMARHGDWQRSSGRGTHRRTRDGEQVSAVGVARDVPTVVHARRVRAVGGRTHPRRFVELKNHAAERRLEWCQSSQRRHLFIT